MAMDILWSPAALDHLSGIFEYILSDNPDVALSVHEEIEKTVSMLTDNSRLGHPGRVQGTRELVVPQYPAYIIVYEILRNEVHVLAVKHGAQQWPDSFG
jgi:toxin ParE1/3/4